MHQDGHAGEMDSTVAMGTPKTFKKKQTCPRRELHATDEGNREMVVTAMSGSIETKTTLPSRTQMLFPTTSICYLSIIATSMLSMSIQLAQSNITSSMCSRDQIGQPSLSMIITRNKCRIRMRYRTFKTSDM